MNVAQVGLDSMYWPIAWAEALREHAASAPAATQRPTHRLVACCDLGVAAHDVASEISMAPADYAARYGLKLYSTVEELVDKERIDAALVATRNTRAAEAAGRLIDKGIPCYVSKPIASSPADALMLGHKAEKAGVPCTAGVTTRCFPHYRAVHRVIQDRRIGRVVSVSVMHQHGSFAAWPARTWYRDPAEGGVPYWLGWYPLETVRWMAASEVASVGASGVNVTNAVRGEHEVIAASGATRNGACWSCRIYFAAGGNWKFPMHEVEVFGEKGIVRTLTDSRIQVFDDAGLREEGVEAPPGDPVRRELLNWLGTIAGKATWHPTLKELGHTVTACEALRRALRTGQVAQV
jgi:predicted dehydrogenase